MYECISFVCYVLLLPSAFKMLSLCLVFVSLITMCLVMFLLRLSCLGLFVPLGLEWLFLFPCWGKFQLESLQKFSHTISFLLFFWDPYNLNVGAFDMVPEVSETVLRSSHSFYFILLFRSYFHYLSSSSLISFFCFGYSDTDSF